MSKKNSKVSKLTSKIFYGVGNLGYGAVSQTFTNFIMFFGTSVMKISGSLMGIAVAISTLWDAVTDPIVGYASDHNKSKLFGRRHGFLLIAMYGMCICNLLLWGVPNMFGTAAKFAWILITMIMLETFNTFFATPYVALGAEITNEYNERTEIQMYKTVGFLIALALPTIFLKIFLPDSPEFPQGQLNPQGYLNMAFVTSTILLVCGYLMYMGTYTYLPRLQAKAEKERLEQGAQPKKKVKEILKDFGGVLFRKNFRNIIFGYAIALISAAILTGVGMHFFTYTFHFSSNQLTITLASLLLGTVLSQPLWLWVSKKWEKKPALLMGIATSFFGIGMLFIVFLCRGALSSGALLGLTIPCVLIGGIGTGALYSLPSSMFNDLIAIEHEKTKEEKTATYSSAMTLAFKVANAIASLGIGFMLDAIRFNPNNIVQAPSVQAGLGWFVFIGIAASLIGGFLIYRGYNVTRDMVPSGSDESYAELTIERSDGTITQTVSPQIENEITTNSESNSNIENQNAVDSGIAAKNVNIGSADLFNEALNGQVTETTFSGDAVTSIEKASENADKLIEINENSITINSHENDISKSKTNNKNNLKKDRKHKEKR